MNRRVWLIFLALATLPSPVIGQEAARTLRCEIPRSPASASDMEGTGPTGNGVQSTGALGSDLACIQLVPTDRGGAAAGAVHLIRPPSPFGVSVTPAGHHVFDLVAEIEALPDPASLGPYTTYVAWATPMTLDPVVRLGEVTSGSNPLGPVSFNSFLILISAEGSADGAERRGPLILRGRSPSSRMQGHDMLALAPAAELTTRGAHLEPSEWTLPPMYPGIPMLPGIISLRPDVAPLLPLSTSLIDVPEASPRQVVDLPNGGTLDLVAGFVRRRIEGQDLLMLAFNGQQPGPMIRVGQGTTIFVNFENQSPFPTAVHWHGVRLDNRFDGVPGVTQAAVEPGGTFRYEITFPDAGIYWYHPHHREDVQQELGLYGNMVVASPDPGYYGPVNHEEVLMLDDLLIGQDGVVPFGDESSNYALMGRFGNVMLVNGEPDYHLSVNREDVVRFHLTNASNTRTFNLSFDPPAQIKVVASDVGRFEQEVWVQNIVIAPAERYVVDVRFPTSSDVALLNRVQGINHRQGVFLAEIDTLGMIMVSDRLTTQDHRSSFEVLRTYDDVVADIDRYRERFNDAPDLELILSLEVTDLPLAMEQSMLYDWVYFNPVEWTGTMPAMNWASTGTQVSWVLRDAASGAQNEDIDWRFKVGDVVKIRLVNDRKAVHAMQHPLHIHGQRFLVVEQDGQRNAHLVWKDTVLLPTGSVTDILLDITNPGRWMVHCHIAEHLESGMRFIFDVEER